VGGSCEAGDLGGPARREERGATRARREGGGGLAGEYGSSWPLLDATATADDLLDVPYSLSMWTSSTHLLLLRQSPPSNPNLNTTLDLPLRLRLTRPIGTDPQSSSLSSYAPQLHLQRPVRTTRRHRRAYVMGRWTSPSWVTSTLR
jgi:hypothetical protein